MELNNIKHNFIISWLLITSINESYAQTNFPTDPDQAALVTDDIPRFWQSFDLLEQGVEGNPFDEYILTGSPGVKDFIENRIIHADSLLEMVKNRKNDYLAIKENSYKAATLDKQIRSIFYAFKYWYPLAVFPPVYFVIGRFNSGGTSSENGLIIGMEMTTDISYIPYTVAHELIHYQQTFPDETTLLEQSIKEGSADFLGELISGKHGDDEAFEYGEKHTEELCREFVEIMDSYEYQGWLYGNSGLKEGRVRDLGYWMGYKITEAYFNKAKDKKVAVGEILNITDFTVFLRESGYLNDYME